MFNHWLTMQIIDSIAKNLPKILCKNPAKNPQKSAAKIFCPINCPDKKPDKKIFYDFFNKKPAKNLKYIQKLYNFTKH